MVELNQAIALLMVDLNQRAFKKLPGNRRSAFEQLDLPALQPLPANRFDVFRWKSAKVNIDYHVEFEGLHAEQRQLFEETLAADQADLEAQLAALMKLDFKVSQYISAALSGSHN